MNDEKENRIITWALVLVCGVLPLVYCLSHATPDQWAQVIMVVIFAALIFFGLVAAEK